MSGQPKLTGKQRAFVQAYMSNGFNGVRAAQVAGYGGSYSVLCVIANDNLRKPNIAALIDAEFKARSMGSDETLARLAQHARGNIGDVLTEEGRFDLGLARERGTVGLIKKIKIKTTRYFPQNGDPEEETTHELELYDAQSALEKIGRAQKLFVDRQQVEGIDGGALRIVHVIEPELPDNHDDGQT